ncbi:MAG: hypothetical protein IIA45_13130 [Bacteroidetes bacterium]|nr:hypothetical protein [Bacteroidota bacterium]
MRVPILLILSRSVIFIVLIVGLGVLSSPAQEAVVKRSAIVSSLMIANWLPPSEQNGMEIKRLTLEYDYSIRDDLPFQKVRLEWFAGHSLNFEGVSYSNVEVGQEMFDEVVITALVLKTKVYSENKYVADWILTFDASEPLTSGYGGWSSSSSVVWNDFFEKTSGQKAKKIFSSGFSLKYPEITFIEFERIKISPEKIVEINDNRVFRAEQEKLMAIEVEEIDSLDEDRPVTAKDLRTALDKIKKSSGEFFEIMVRDFQSGKIKQFKGLSWYYNFTTGLNYLRYPINVNVRARTRSDNSISNDTKTELKYGGGFGLMSGSEFWPLFGKNLGIGMSGVVTAGGMPKLYTSYTANVGINGYAGGKLFKVFFEYSKGYRLGSYFVNTQSYIAGVTTYYDAVAIIDYRFNRVGIGPKLWIDRKEPIIFDLRILVDKPQGKKISWIKKGTIVWRADVWKINKFKMNIQYF